jgi:Uma2 family endonuclease
MRRERTPMAEHTLAWNVGHEAMGPLLEAAVEEMNAHGPFTVGDEATEKAPKYAELVDGAFRVMSPASWFHSAATTAVAKLLDSLLGKAVVATHAPVKISDKTLRESDVAVYLGRTLGPPPGTTYPDFLPDLIVEVLSASTAAEDRGPKKTEYELIGVREYYLLDPSTASVEAFILRKGSYVALEPEEGGFPSTVLGQSWDPASVLANELDE